MSHQKLAKLKKLLPFVVKGLSNHPNTEDLLEDGIKMVVKARVENTGFELLFIVTPYMGWYVSYDGQLLGDEDQGLYPPFHSQEVTLRATLIYAD